MKLLSFTLPAIVLWATSCSSIGPPTIPRDRFDYGEAISDSWKEQMLLSIVKLRYVDMPTFVEVSSVINQYVLAGDASVARAWGDIDGDTAAAGVRFEDRPTITYSPIAGKKFTQNLMTPVPPAALLFLAQSGWDIEKLFLICAQAVNGAYNRGGSSTLGREAAEERFAEVVDLLATLQRSGAVGLRIEGMEMGEAVVLVIRRREDAALAEESARLRTLLGLDLNAEQFRISYGSDAVDDTNIAILTRSVFEILIELARQIEVPPEDVEEGRTIATPSFLDESGGRLIHVHQAAAKPDDAFVRVRYRDRWFWIDDRDMASKSTFAFLMVLFNLTETGAAAATPLLTVGAS